MPQPRYRQVSIEDTPYYLCISRCVRRAAHTHTLEDGCFTRTANIGDSLLNWFSWELINCPPIPQTPATAVRSCDVLCRSRGVNLVELFIVGFSQESIRCNQCPCTDSCHQFECWPAARFRFAFRVSGTRTLHRLRSCTLCTLPCRLSVLAPLTEKSLLQKLYSNFADTYVLDRTHNI